jgi:Putative prokaryotic signal transducing protein
VDDEVSVTVVGSEPEAELACQLLRTEDIACYHRPTSFAAGAGDGLVSLGSPREIVVRAKDAGRARELLADA